MFLLNTCYCGLESICDTSKTVITWW